MFASVLSTAASLASSVDVANWGTTTAARIARMITTISSSTRVKPCSRTQMRFEFPLDGEHVATAAHADLRDVEMPGAFEGYDLSHGALVLRLDPQGMDVGGAARLDGVPANVTWRENFADAAQYRSRFTIRGRFTDAQRLLLGMPGNDWVEGPINVDIDVIDSDQGPRRWRANTSRSARSMRTSPCRPSSRARCSISP